MRDDDREKPSECAVSALPPQGLFSRIIKRLGLEKELVLVQGHLKFFTVLLAAFLALSVFAFIGVGRVLATSNFGPFLYLVLSDPGVVIKYWRSFIFAAFESMPGVVIAGLIFSLAFVMLFARFALFATAKIAILTKSINQQKYAK